MCRDQIAGRPSSKECHASFKSVRGGGRKGNGLVPPMVRDFVGGLSLHMSVTVPVGQLLIVNLKESCVCTML